MIEIRTVKDNTNKFLNDLNILNEIIEKAATETEKEMKKSITNGAKTGLIYTRRGVKHRSSAPGQAPANDTGKLVGSISTKSRKKGIVEVVIGALYAMPLEFGNSRMKARPFIIPAVEKVSKKLEKLFEVLFK